MFWGFVLADCLICVCLCQKSLLFRCSYEMSALVFCFSPSSAVITQRLRQERRAACAPLEVKIWACAPLRWTLSRVLFHIWFHFRALHPAPHIPLKHSVYTGLKKGIKRDFSRRLLRPGNEAWRSWFKTTSIHASVKSKQKSTSGWVASSRGTSG